MVSLYPLSFRMHFPLMFLSPHTEPNYHAVVCEQAKPFVPTLFCWTPPPPPPPPLPPSLNPSALAPGCATALTFFISPSLELSPHETLRRAYNTLGCP